MGTEKHMVIPSVLVAIWRRAEADGIDEVLLMRRAHSGFQDGLYTLPSGHIERGEPATIAASREVREEVGIEILPEDFTFQQAVYRRGFNNVGEGYDPTQPERADYIFSTEQWQGEPRVVEPDKCDDVRWFPLHEIPENTFPVVRDFLKAYPHHPQFREAGY